ncbi:glutaminyl-tRNA synthetase [Cryomyces antarcticus]
MTGDTPKVESLNIDRVEEPKISKKELKRLAAKAEKEKKRAEHQASGAPAKPPKSASTATVSTTASEDPNALFGSGWLDATYKERPIPVRTRFPPEPNGFLHIGHAKAIMVNFGFARYYNGKCFLRYDDTNPAKEEEKYFTAIKDMVEWLGFSPYTITYSSDHFDKLYSLAEKLITKDKAYVCHCTKEEVNMGRGGPDNRGERKACAHRNRPVEESLTEFRAMRNGEYKAGEAHLRMKSALTNPNVGNTMMWDVAAYRVVEKNHHHRTGDTWRVYPTYDFAHCLCDFFEGISHSLCTVEFFLSRTVYNWVLAALDLKQMNLADLENKRIPTLNSNVSASEKDEYYDDTNGGPIQREYGRLNVEGTILSKRKIALLVEGGKATAKDGSEKTLPSAVRDWDDPRLFTLVAIRRRGIPPGALIKFVSTLGVSPALTNIEIVKFESIVRSYLEEKVPRLSLVLDPIRVTITNLPDDHLEELDVAFHAKIPSYGSHTVPFTKTIYIDRSDFREQDDPDFFRLAPGKPVGLTGGNDKKLRIIKATSFTKDPTTGLVTDISATLEPSDSPKPKAFIHWIGGPPSGANSKFSPVTAEVRLHNALFRSDKPDELDWKTGGYIDDLNPDSEVVFPNALIECGFDEVRRRAPWPAAEGEKEGASMGMASYAVRFQGLRTAYFCVDADATAEKVVLNRIVTLKEDAGKK